MKTRLPLISLMCAMAALLSTPADAQVTGTSPQYNWQDKSFAPDEQDGALHLRIGFSGLAPGISVGKKASLARGNGSCDMVYLYFAISRRALPKDYSEACAVAEYELSEGFKPDAISSLNNAFTKKNVIDKFLPVVNERMAKIGGAKRFYLKVPVRIVRVDPVQSSVDLDFDLNGNSWLGALPGGRMIFKERQSDAGHYQPLQRVDQQLAQTLEDSRLAYGEHYGEVYFSVKGVGPANPDMNASYLVFVDDVQYKVYYYTKAGGYQTFSTF